MKRTGILLLGAFHGNPKVSCESDKKGDRYEQAHIVETIFFLCVFCAATAIASPAQTFKTLSSFNGTDGADPEDSSLVQGFDGNFYGTTCYGGAHLNSGTVFKITPAGTLTTLHSFDGTDGRCPFAGLLLGTDGNFYGTTWEGGPHGNGTVFKITPAGTLTTLHSFDYTDGSGPSAGLVQATDGNFYGTTEGGGVYGVGTVFKITAAGTLTVLYSFCPTLACPDGGPPSAGLVQATDGNFYGTTKGGGAANFGTVFKISAAGKLTTLHSFDDSAYQPSGTLVQATNGNFYGTTQAGGANGDGMVYKITPAGALTVLHSFNGSDGDSPSAGLVQATNGNFYGTTQAGGAHVDGTVFEITAGGTLTTLHSFDGTDGAGPLAELVQATNGNFYGTTNGSGANGDGTVFSLSVGLGPFVETLPTSGKVGTPVIILGNNLTGSTTVTFNPSKVATFTVVSSTEIKTTVPSGATTGKIKVVTPSRTLTSNLNFRVTPTITSFSPTSGPVGTVVTINGKSFITGATTVTFAGGVKGTITSLTYTKIIVTVPTGAKTDKITVITPRRHRHQRRYFYGNLAMF